MKREDDQELWDLLGKTGAPTLSPFFARNVVRQIRQERQRLDWHQAVLGWLRPRVLVPSAAFAVAVILAVVGVKHQNPSASLPADEVPLIVAQIDPRDYEVVADLDNLLAFEEEESLWGDT